MLNKIKQNYYYAKCRIRNFSSVIVHRKKLPKLDEYGIKIVSDINKYGYHVTSLDKLNAIDTELMLKDVSECISSLGENVQKGPKGFVLSPSEKEISKYKNLIKWGLNEWFLDIAENYLKLPVNYRGPMVRKDIPNGQKSETRLWHRDGEDFKLLKIVVYLNNVSKKKGPLMTIPRSSAPPKKILKNKGPKMRVEDEDMEKFVKRQHWKSLTGKKGTVIFVDTAGIFHCGGMQIDGQRHSVFFTYNSNIPTNPSWCLPLFELNKLDTKQLSAKQTKALSLYMRKS